MLGLKLNHVSKWGPWHSGDFGISFCYLTGIDSAQSKQRRADFFIVPSHYDLDHIGVFTVPTILKRLDTVNRNSFQENKNLP